MNDDAGMTALLPLHYRPALNSSRVRSRCIRYHPGKSQMLMLLGKLI